MDHAQQPSPSPSPSPRAITPVTGPIDATVRVPGSKSLTNRALLLAALGTERCTIANALASDDTHYFTTALRALGITAQADTAAQTITVAGAGGTLPVAAARLFVGNAGTAARFLTAFSALGSGCYDFDGVPRMRERPMVELLDALTSQGARISHAGAPGCMPFTVCGSGLAGGVLRIAGARSSQPISAALMVAPYARADLRVEVAGELVSAPFVAMTVQLMQRFGVAATARPLDGGMAYEVAAGQRYALPRWNVEPDATSASYFFAAAAVTGGTVRLLEMPRDSLQGDLGFLDVLEQMGCTIRRTATVIEVRGPERLQGVDVDMAAISDTAPTLAAIAPFANGPVTIRGIAHTRLQETDRIAASAQELRRLGIAAEELADGLRISPGQPRAASVATYDDHRIAMSFAVTGLRTPGLVIENPGCTAKTFPDFFERFEQLSHPSA